MKSLRLFILLLMPLLLTNCAKKMELEYLPSTDEMLKGTWTERSLTVIYYGAGGEQLHEQSNPTGRITFDGNSNATAVYPDREVEKARYTVSIEGNKTYLKVENSSETRVYNIASISGSEMTLILQNVNDTYVSDGNICVAASSILTSRMTKN